MSGEQAGTLAPAVVAVVWVIALVALVFAWRRSRRRGGPGPGAAGAVYDMLNEDKRHAIELIVEQRAEERRPEYADGHLPDLAAPSKPPSKP